MLDVAPQRQYYQLPRRKIDRNGENFIAYPPAWFKKYSGTLQSACIIDIRTALALSLSLSLGERLLRRDGMLGLSLNAREFSIICLV